MKKMMTSIKTLAALLIASATFAACSSDDNTIDQQPAQPAGQQVYTMTIEATKGGDAATTRALSLDGKTLNAIWQTTDKVAVYNSTQQATLGGHLSPQSDGASATLTGSLTGSVAKDDVIYLRWPSVDADYTGQDGTLETIAQRYDYTTGVAKVTSVDGTAIVAEDSSPSGGPVTFTNSQAIVKFTLIDKATATAINATQLTIDAKVGEESRLIQSITYPDAYTLGPITINRTEPTDNVVYAALPFSSQASFTFSLTATDGTHNYTYEKSDVTMINGRYYEVKVKMTRDTYPITLNEVTSDNLGSVVTTDGTVYATVADASAASKTAAGMIAYVGEIGQGLAIALTDETGTMNWSTAITTAAAHTPAVTGYSWRLPNLDEWKQMFSANGNNEGSYTGLNTAITNAGGEALQDGGNWYWSITEYNDSKACYVDLRDNAATFGGFSKVGDDSNFSVRACLAFGPARGHALASSAVGEIVGSDGLAYYASDKNDLPSGVTAVAMIAYKSTAGESLAIQLNASPASKNWSDAKTYASGLTAVPGGTWRLPSMADWQNMFVGCAKSGDAGAGDTMDPIAGFKEKIGATGITWQSTYYWSSSDSESYAWSVGVYLNDSNASANFVKSVTSTPSNVLGCLAF